MTTSRQNYAQLQFERQRQTDAEALEIRVTRNPRARRLKRH
jgi:hypothetical protein